MSKAVMYVLTAVFGSIIWFLEETLFAYAYMMHQYTMYQEILFVLIIGVLSLYCTGLVRDRNRSGADSDDSDEETDESEDDTGADDEGDGGDARIHEPKEKKKRKKKGDVPPAYVLNDDIPDYDDIENSPNQEDSHLDDLLPITDSEDEFDLDANVGIPHYLDSGSESDHVPDEEAFNKDHPLIPEVEGGAVKETLSSSPSDIENIQPGDLLLAAEDGASPDLQPALDSHLAVFDEPPKEKVDEKEVPHDDDFDLDFDIDDADLPSDLEYEEECKQEEEEERLLEERVAAIQQRKEGGQ
jgi:hypothetical protein